MQNKLKPATTPAITELNEANIRTIMVTGNSNQIIFHSPLPFFFKADPYHDFTLLPDIIMMIIVPIVSFAYPSSYSLSSCSPSLSIALPVSLSVLYLSLSPLSVSLSLFTISFSFYSILSLCPSVYSLSVCVSVCFLTPLSPSQVCDNLANVIYSHVHTDI